jgi:glutaredoxin 3
MTSVVMYCTAVCPYCVRAEHLLINKGVEIDKIRVDLEPARFEEMLQLSGGRRTVPQIFVGDTHVGGYDDLVALDRGGKLDSLLETVAQQES